MVGKIHRTSQEQKDDAEVDMETGGHQSTTTPLMMASSNSKPTMDAPSSQRPAMRRSGAANDSSNVRWSAFEIEADGTLKHCTLEEALAGTAADPMTPSPPVLSASPQVDNGVATDAAAAAAGPAAVNAKKSYWIDMELRTPHDRELLQREIVSKMTLTKFLRRHLTRPVHFETSQVIALSTAMLVVVRILAPEDSLIDTKSYDAIHPHHAAIYCQEHLMLTVTTLPPISPNARHLPKSTFNMIVDEDRELPEASVSGAFCLWMQCHLDLVSAGLNQLRAAIYALVEISDKNVHDLKLDDIMGVKDDLLRLLAIAEEQNEVIPNVVESARLTAALNFSRLNGSTGVLLSSASSAERMALRLEKRLADLRQTYDGCQQDRINRRLAVLTLLSAIFLPLTLMAGIWGMNFENMPELRRENAYYFAVASMVLVAIAMLLAFYRLGWFDT